MIFGAACLIAGIVLGAGFRSCSGKPAEPRPADPAVIHDTVTVHDTAYIAKKTKPKEVVRHDTLWLPAVAENATTDTMNADFALVPITQYEYRDTFTTDSSRIELGVQFSGYKAQIDGIDLRSQYTVQPRTIMKKKGWGQFIGVGIGVGYGASVVGHTVYAAPEIGVHVVYGFGYTWKK